MSFAKLAVLAAVAAPALAHMKMTDPKPFRYDTDSDYLAALSQPAQFPCKGYAGDGGPATGTLTAGSTFSVQLSGSAVHGGGSCQFSLSYDGGKTFGVIHQIIGNCPTENQKFDVPVPAGLPSAQGAIFAWTWFNKIGNREIYMNCAPVDVMGSSGSMELPRMFEANIPGGGGCTVPETTDVDFNNPQLTNCPSPITPDQKVTVGSGAPTTSTGTTAPTGGETTTPTGGDDPCPTESDGGEPTGTPTGTTMPTGTATPPTTGGGNAWDAAKVYVSGDSACYNSQTYTAKWWTQGETPGAGDVWGTPAGAC
ncbi:hypothetical protein BKA62DRAFT_641386 [Auriculariales sp. MPI-PUGE-AT-0066]|nr:hypothetical protein BKA62DRAFT_641386 [Auriculariales sp. MPI-PUGE-AT-0066]